MKPVPLDQTENLLRLEKRTAEGLLGVGSIQDAERYAASKYFSGSAMVIQGVQMAQDVARLQEHIYLARFGDKDSRKDYCADLGHTAASLRSSLLPLLLVVSNEREGALKKESDKAAQIIRDFFIVARATHDSANRLNPTPLYKKADKGIKECLKVLEGLAFPSPEAGISQTELGIELRRKCAATYMYLVILELRMAAAAKKE